MSNEINRPQLPKVIVRSFGGEPVTLFAHRFDANKKRVLVGQAYAKRPISLPLEDVFPFEAGRFAELSEAFKRGDRKRLTDLYKTLGRNNSSCSRYQIMLDSQHEEEPEI